MRVPLARPELQLPHPAPVVLHRHDERGEAAPDEATVRQAHPTELFVNHETRHHEPPAPCTSRSSIDTFSSTPKRTLWNTSMSAPRRAEDDLLLTSLLPLPLPLPPPRNTRRSFFRCVFHGRHMANLATDFRVMEEQCTTSSHNLSSSISSRSSACFSVDASKTSIAEVLARRVEISSSSYSYPEEEVGMGYKRCDIACVISIGFVAFVRYRIYRM